jgi:hypothetical protein
MRRSSGFRLNNVLVVVSVPLVLLGMVLGALVLLRQAPPSAYAAAGPVPAGMPAHFSFGIMDAPGDTGYLNGMRQQNGTTWDFRYQYLAGGVNTGHGWATWNAPAGQFAMRYMRESGTNGYTPAFVYYQLLQSNGPSGGSESATDLAHLADPTTMRAYYGDWALLMRQIGAYGQRVLVIVEPDLWGVIEQRALASGSKSAASVPASVASSGSPEAQGLPNTAQGFAWTLLRIRDRYAPNALLALHASPWGTGTDIASNTSPTLNAPALGTQTGQFLATAGLRGVPAGISTFDLLSADIADHDSGQSGIWWDRNNVTFPNFARYLQFASALANAAGRRILLWQVPEGNQVFDTENNTPGHTQDNRAEYILGHIPSFVQAGIIGVLFGPGNGGTNATDVRHDGVTNAAPISTYECNRCNTHPSVYADDDGGYLRLMVGQYYRGGAYALSLAGAPAPAPTLPTTAPATPATPPGPTATPPPSAPSRQPATPATPPPGPSPSGACVPTIAFGASQATPTSVAVGGSVMLTTTLRASCAIPALVDFELYDGGQKIWQRYQDNQRLTGSDQTFTATWAVPQSQAGGTYILKIGVFNAGWGVLYGWDNAAATISVTGAALAGSCAAPTITFGGATAMPAVPVRDTHETFSATLRASCATTGLVDFELYDSTGQKVWQSYEDNQSLTGGDQTFTATWAVPVSLPAGTYTLKIGVFNAGWGVLYGWDDQAGTLTLT